MIAKNSDFNAVFSEDYLVDTTADRTVTLPDPTGNEGKVMSFYNDGAGSIIFSGQNINGIASVKNIKKNDFFKLIVKDGAYILITDSVYIFSPTKLWRIDIDDSGVISTTQANT